ncbi:MAG: HYR domain-containing protein [Bacteroidota bacterium]|nr:HYR domain-containing protein [Bacteroidota bacterium]
MKQFDFVGNNITSVAAAPAGRQRWGHWPVVFRVLLLCLLVGLGAANPARASHFRYGGLTWRTVTTDPSKLTVQFKVSQAWRRSFGPFSTVTIGSTVLTDVLNFGDGSTSNVNLTVTSVDIAGDSFFGEALITHTYATAGAYQAFYTNCCRLNTLLNNANSAWYLSSLVAAGSGNNSPVATVAPVVNLAAGQVAATFLLPASDPDGDPLTFSLATAADFNGNAFMNAPGLDVNPTTGMVTFNTLNRTPGSLYNAVIKVSDGQTSILVDFLINVTATSTAPVFDYSITPPNGFVYQLAPGQTLNFGVRATDSDAGDVVTLQAYGAPLGTSLTPTLPLNGNPVQTAFAWTPTAANLGTTVINFVAQDLAGVQTSTSVTVEVSLRPRFDVPPTPANGSAFQVTPGTVLSYPIQASSPDPASQVQVVSLSGLPAGAGFATALPSAAANPTSAQFGWTPVLADWGPHAATFTARDGFGQQVTHTLNFVINSAPSFTTQPSGLALAVGQTFTYNIVTTDPDLPFGDVLAVLAPALPAWLTLVDNGNGTATLSGTATAAQIGTHRVVLAAEDIYHHGNSYGSVLQQFYITVAGAPTPTCNLQLATTKTSVSCNGLADGSIQLSATGAAAPFTFGWRGPAGFSSTAQNPTGLAAGTYTVSVRSADGCTATAQATVTQPAVQMPQLSCGANISVASAATSCGAVVKYTAPVGTHSCRPVTTVRSAGPASGSVFPVGNTTITYTATDNAGQATTCSFTVQVRDVTPPTVHTRNITVSLVNGVAKVTAAQVNNGSSDACGIAGMSLSPNSFTCANLGDNRVMLAVTDLSGNTASAPATVHVIGTVTPLTISVTRANNVYTGGPNTTIYLGYGAQSLTLTASGGTTYRWSPAAGLSNPNIANPVFAPTATGTYTYTVTSNTAGGCAAKAAITLKVIDVRCGKDCGDDDHHGDGDDHGDDDDHHGDGKHDEDRSAAAILTSCGEHEGDDDHGCKNYKVLVCHNGHAICISVNAVPAHLLNASHHDNLGACTGVVIGTHGEDDDDDNGHHGHEDRIAPTSSGQIADLGAAPNPFVSSTSVHFRTVATAPAQVRVYDPMGRLVTTLFEGTAEGGRDYELPVNSGNWPTGLYMCHLVSQGETRTQRLEVAK